MTELFARPWYEVGLEFEVWSLVFDLFYTHVVYAYWNCLDQTGEVRI